MKDSPWHLVQEELHDQEHSDNPMSIYNEIRSDVCERKILLSVPDEYPISNCSCNCVCHCYIFQEPHDFISPRKRFYSIVIFWCSCRQICHGSINRWHIQLNVIIKLLRASEPTLDWNITLMLVIPIAFFFFSSSTFRVTEFTHFAYVQECDKESIAEVQRSSNVDPRREELEPSVSIVINYGESKTERPEEYAVDSTEESVAEN